MRKRAYGHIGCFEKYCVFSVVTCAVLHGEKKQYAWKPLSLCDRKYSVLFMF